MSHLHGQSCCSSDHLGGSHSQTYSYGCGCPTCPCKGKGNFGSKQSSFDYAGKFLELADQAWAELLKDKIKEHIQLHAKHLDELASLIAEANHERWKKKVESKQSCGNYEEKLRAFFQHSCECCEAQGKKH